MRAMDSVWASDREKMNPPRLRVLALRVLALRLPDTDMLLETARLPLTAMLPIVSMLEVLREPVITVVERLVPMRKFWA